MLEILDLMINSNIIYIVIIVILVIIIIITMLSMKNDRDKIVNSKKIKEVEQPIEVAKTEEEKEHARLELEKVVNKMKNNLDTKKDINEIETYEQEQEEKAIISYQELVDAVRKNKENYKPQTEIGMEVASTSAIEEPTSVEEKIYEEELDKKADDVVNMLNNIEITKEEKEENIEIKTQKKFQTSEFISPIYGRQPRVEISDNKDLESLNDTLNDDFSNTDEFLDSLKNFRSKL